MTEIVLKDGSTTEDPRLDRLVEFDEQSREYPVRRGLELKKPRGYTWSVKGNLDQGREGACVGFAFGHDAIARPRPLPWVTDEFAKTKIYWRAQEIDPWPGGAFPGATPFYEGTSVLSGAKAATELGFFKEYQWAFGLNDLILAVGYKGPAVIGIDWFDGMYRPNAEGFLKPTGQVIGGHAILVYSVNWRDKFFRLWNSWGADWGEGGSTKVSFEDMGFLLDRDGEVCVPVLRGNVKAS